MVWAQLSLAQIRFLIAPTTLISVEALMEVPGNRAMVFTHGGFVYVAKLTEQASVNMFTPLLLLYCN